MIEITRDIITFPKRDKFAHKGSFGRVLLICGSKKYTGAAFFAAQSAVITGSGLVFLSVPNKIRPILASKLNEPILVSRKEVTMRCDAALIGCGLGLGMGSHALVKKALFTGTSPIVVDADAITLLAKHKISLDNLPREVILTPHEGEFSRLVPEFDPSRREEFARNFAIKNNVTLVLKGHRTITASKSGELYVNTTGNPGMAKGGSGDILSGIITSLLGQGISPHIAAYTGVWLHGASGDNSAESFGEYAMTPTDMLCSLKSVLCEVQLT